MGTAEGGVPEERLGPLHDAIADELIALTPEGWNAALLSVSVEHREGTMGMQHEISSPEGHREPVMPGDDLFALTRQLYLLFLEFDVPWTEVSYEVRLLPEGSWKYVCVFAYDG